MLLRFPVNEMLREMDGEDEMLLVGLRLRVLVIAAFVELVVGDLLSVGEWGRDRVTVLSVLVVGDAVSDALSVADRENDITGDTVLDSVRDPDPDRKHVTLNEIDRVDVFCCVGVLVVERDCDGTSLLDSVTRRVDDVDSCGVGEELCESLTVAVTDTVAVVDTEPTLVNDAVPVRSTEVVHDSETVCEKT